MNCPICNKSLTEYEDYYYCTEKHGALLTANHLINKQTTIVDENLSLESNQKVITCPKCNSEMHKINYSHTGIIIDSCMKCHSRWLDGGEFTKIKNHKPKLTEKQLLHLLEIESNMMSKEDEMDNTIPGYASGRAGAVGRIVSSGDSRRTLGWMSGGFIIGVVRTLIKGNIYQRIVLLFALILFALFFLFLWNQVKTSY